MNKDKIEELIAASKLNELLHKKDVEESKKKSNVIIIVLAVIGAVAALAAIVYAIYRYFTPDYLDDFDDDFDDDDAHPNHEKSGDRIKLHRCNYELGKDDEQRNRQHREKGIPLGNCRHISGLDGGRLRVNVSVLAVVIALHEVVRHAADNKRRNRKRQLILYEINNGIEPCDLGGETRGTRGRCKGHARGGPDHGSRGGRGSAHGF